MTLKDRISQVVKIFSTALALIAITVYTRIVMTMSLMILALAMRALYSFRPTQRSYLFVTKTVVNDFLNAK